MQICQTLNLYNKVRDLFSLKISLEKNYLKIIFNLCLVMWFIIYTLSCNGGAEGPSKNLRTGVRKFLWAGLRGMYRPYHTREITPLCQLLVPFIFNWA